MSETQELILEAKHVTKKYPASGGRMLTANNDVSLKMYRGRTDVYKRQHDGYSRGRNFTYFAKDLSDLSY